jgi:hypothetical protein
MRAALLALVLLAGCGASQAKLHATALGWTHGVLDTSATAIEEGCALAVDHAPTVERAREVAAGCRRAAEVQHSLVEVWTLWATAALAKLEGRDFNLGLARGFATRVVAFYRELDEALTELSLVDLPDLPPLVLRLFAED